MRHSRILHGLSLAAIAAAGVFLSFSGLDAAQSSCPTCPLARVWEVPPDDWQRQGRPEFPEQARLDKLRPTDVGAAFSGGGTRSASASLGQLRALARNGWLSRVRYITAASGGSWATVPFTFAAMSTSDFLGPPVAPAQLTAESIKVATTGGRLGEMIVASNLAHVGLEEIPSFAPDAVDEVLKNIRGLIRRVRGGAVSEPDRRNKTYSHMLGQKFITPVIPEGNRQLYTWDDESALDMAVDNPGLHATDFMRAAPDHPFLIVLGTLVLSPDYYSYPRLVPVEYTPLYTGIRQRFGKSIGGVYVSPWAYDRRTAERVSADRIRVSPGPSERMFTLADVVASSGAAPQLAMIVAEAFPARVRDAVIQAGEAFPAFTPITVRGGVPAIGKAELPHGDGGFTDNLAIMPLLARQVHNILVFVNSSSAFDRNDQLESYFRALDKRAGSGDKSMNPVFTEERYAELLAGLRALEQRGAAPVFCGRNWSVKANELYNIRAYDGLNICWVYNDDASAWHDALPPAVQAWFAEKPAKADEAKQLQHFPHYGTFGENKPHLIQLSALQVNLLANLAYWSLTNGDTARAISQAFGGVLPVPASAAEDPALAAASRAPACLPRHASCAGR